MTDFIAYVSLILLPFLYFLIFYDFLYLTSKLLKIENKRFSINLLGVVLYSLNFLISYYSYLFLFSTSFFSLFFILWEIILFFILGVFIFKNCYKSSWKKSVLASLLMMVFVFLVILLIILVWISMWSEGRFQILFNIVPELLFALSLAYFIYSFKVKKINK